MMKNFEQFLKESSESKDSELFFTFEDFETKEFGEETEPSDNPNDPGIWDEVTKTFKKVAKKMGIGGSDDKKKEEVKPDTSVLTPSVKKYLGMIADRESSNKPDNWRGDKGNPASLYLGLYQFGLIALVDITKQNPGESEEEHRARLKKFMPKGFHKIETSKGMGIFAKRFFKEGEKFWPREKQDLAMVEYLKLNHKYLKDEITKYAKKTMKGIKISVSGILAGAHLVGQGGVKQFFSLYNRKGEKLKDSEIPKDGNGTKITEYMDEFKNFQLPFLK
jgi:hypothetical protein